MLERDPRRWPDYGQKSEVQTTDGTETAIASVVLLDNSVYSIEVDVVGLQSDGANRASYRIISTFYRYAGGGAAAQGTATLVHVEESDINWDVALTPNGNNIDVNVTGYAATTINWICYLKYIKKNN
jgi:hypothetical protein